MIDPAKLAVIEDMLRTVLGERTLKRVMFALNPPAHPTSDACACCGADLSTRPVLTTTRNSAHTAAFNRAREEWLEQHGKPGLHPPLRVPIPENMPPEHTTRRVRMKPAQAVASLSIEGAHGMTPDLYAELKKLSRSYRFCVPCLRGLAE